MPKISIIIPVYNTEKYLSQCLDSVINQTFTDFECICVNDGSTDNSLKILKEYSKQDNRIKIISQGNKGAAETRNIGLKCAIGDYILFIDSDDFVDYNFCEILYNNVIKYNADIIYGEIYDYYSDIKRYKFDILQKFNKKQINNKDKYFLIDNMNRFYIFSNFYKIPVVWGKLIKRKILTDNNICFYNCKIAEDYSFTALTLLYSNSIVIDNSVNYYYRKNTDSSLSKNCNMFIEYVLENLKFLKEDIIKRKKDKDNLVKLIDCSVIDILFGYYDNWNVGIFSKSSILTIKQMYPKIKEYLKFFNIEKSVIDSKSKACKIKYILFKFSVKHNIYIMPKIMRIIRNILRIVCFK